MTSDHPKTTWRGMFTTFPAVIVAMAPRFT
jgi:hypothetical protein